ncbi:MAG: hypothetical protein P1V97_04915 [Planctomycetota bacterium]|nr:hypothetical protein [Planctomycetota bacterium]
MNRLIVVTALIAFGAIYPPEANAQDKPEADKYGAVKKELKVISGAAIKYSKDNAGAFPYFKEKEQVAFQSGLKLLLKKKYLKDSDLNPAIKKDDMIGFFLNIPKTPKKPLLLCAARVMADKKMFFALTDGSVVTLDVSNRQQFQSEIKKYLPDSFFNKSKMAGNEASAIGALRAIQSSQAIYREAGKDQRYGSLKELTEAKYIDAVLGSGKKSGYLFKVHLGDKDGKGKEYMFHITATPIKARETGNRHFFTDQSGIIRYEVSKPATAKSPALGTARKKEEVKAKKEDPKNKVRGKSIVENETSVLGNLRTLFASQSIHLERSAKQEYGTLEELQKADYISKALSSGKTMGYIYSIHVGDKDGKNKEYLYHITATPIEVGKTGKRHFFADQSGVVRYSLTGPATKDSAAVSK